MGAQHMLRDKLKLGIVDEKNVLRLTATALADSGHGRRPGHGACRASRARPGLDGRQHHPGQRPRAGLRPARPTPCATAAATTTTPSRSSTGWACDSFTPDNGVLLSKTKNEDEAPFAWVVDAHPEDIDMVDFHAAGRHHRRRSPSATTGSSSDALFHAGADSGSQYEYIDKANRLHFYVLDLKRDRSGVLSYTVAVRSLDGSGRSGVASAWPWRGEGPPLEAPPVCTFDLRNTGAATGTAGRARTGLRCLPAVGDGRRPGWSAWLPNQLATAKEDPVPGGGARYAGRERAARAVQLAATSESDKSKQATATLSASR